MLSLPLRNLGVAAFQQGDHARAVGLLRESLGLLLGLGDKLYTSRGLECLASVESSRGDHLRAARLFGAGEALRREIGAPKLFYLVDYDGAVTATREALGEEAAEAAWEEGRSMTPEEAVALALEGPMPEVGQDARHPPAGAKPRREPLPDGLTAREAEVLGLLAGGMTNKGIAAHLFLSVSTVQRHVANVYAKIGAHGRAGATAYAVRRGLADTGPERDRPGTAGQPG